jgi:hypothetical protein
MVPTLHLSFIPVNFRVSKYRSQNHDDDNYDHNDNKNSTENLIVIYCKFCNS